jgi:hypothetical protein
MWAAIKNADDIGYDDGLTVIISDFFTESDFKSMIDYLLYKKRDVLLIQVLTPQEIDPLYSGRVQLIDAEADSPEDDRNMRMVINKGMYNAYKEALNEYNSEIRQFCRKRNVGYITVNTANPIEKELLNAMFEQMIIG